MKKCPYCAERLKDKDIVCRSCGRVINASNNHFVYKPMIEKEKEYLTYDDFKFLGKSCIESYEHVSKDRYQKLELAGSKIVDNCFSPISVELLRYKLVDNEKDIQNINEQIAASSFFWAWINFSIGVEFCSKRIGKEETRSYIPACNFPFGFHLIEHIMILKASTDFSEENAKMLEEHVIKCVMDEATKLVGEGIDNPTDVRPKILFGGLTPFAIELKRIKAG